MPIILQFVAISEYLLASCVPGVILCTLLNAVQKIVETSGANVDQLCVFQRLLLLLFVEYAITGVSYKLKRPDDAFVFNVLRLLYLFVIWWEVSIVLNMVNVTVLKNIFTVKTLLALLFVAVSVAVQFCDNYEERVAEYRSLASRLYQYWDLDVINIHVYDQEEEEEEEEDEDEKEGQEEEKEEGQEEEDEEEKEEKGQEEKDEEEDDQNKKKEE